MSSRNLKRPGKAVEGREFSGELDRRGLGRASEVVAVGNGKVDDRDAGGGTGLQHDLLQLGQSDYRAPRVDRRGQPEPELDPAHVIRDSLQGLVPGEGDQLAVELAVSRDFGRGVEEDLLPTAEEPQLDEPGSDQIPDGHRAHGFSPCGLFFAPFV